MSDYKAHLIYANDRAAGGNGYICLWDIPWKNTRKVRFEPVGVRYNDLTLGEARKLHEKLGKFLEEHK